MAGAALQPRAAAPGAGVAPPPPPSSSGPPICAQTIILRKKEKTHSCHFPKVAAGAHMWCAQCAPAVCNVCNGNVTVRAQCAPAATLGLGPLLAVLTRLLGFGVAWRGASGAGSGAFWRDLRRNRQATISTVCSRKSKIELEHSRATCLHRRRRRRSRNSCVFDRKKMLIVVVV